MSERRRHRLLQSVLSLRLGNRLPKTSDLHLASSGARVDLRSSRW